jgi:hypothetical protein
VHRDDADQVGARRDAERAAERTAEWIGAAQFDDDADRWLINKERAGDMDAYEVLVRRTGSHCGCWAIGTTRRTSPRTW